MIDRTVELFSHSDTIYVSPKETRCPDQNKFGGIFLFASQLTHIHRNYLII